MSKLRTRILNLPAQKKTVFYLVLGIISIALTRVKILGSESFARWLVSLALVLALEIELALALDIEHYHITTAVSHLTCPLPPHQSVI